MIKSFIEIKNRVSLLIVTILSVFSTSYYYKYQIIIIIIISNPELPKETLNYFIFTSITELFTLYIMLSFFLTTQVLYYSFFYHVICFLSSGLYRKEYMSCKLVFKISIALGVFGFLGFQKILIPLLSHFFLSFQFYTSNSINFYFEAKIYDYILFYKDTYFNFFLSFQSSIFLILLSNYISKNINHLKNTRKFLYLMLLFFSTAITPPDIFSQILLFLCLSLAFEISVFFNIFKQPN